jgi:hypothetical protein
MTELVKLTAALLIAVFALVAGAREQTLEARHFVRLGCCIHGWFHRRHYQELAHDIRVNSIQLRSKKCSNET